MALADYQSQRFSIPVTISAGQNNSPIVDLKGCSLMEVGVPAGWTTGDITIDKSPDGGTTWFIASRLADQSDIKISGALAGHMYAVTPGEVVGAQYIRLSAAVAPAGDTVFTLIAGPV